MAVEGIPTRRIDLPPPVIDATSIGSRRARPGGLTSAIPRGRTLAMVVACLGILLLSSGLAVATPRSGEIPSGGPGPGLEMGPGTDGGAPALASPQVAATVSGPSTGHSTLIAHNPPRPITAPSLASPGVPGGWNSSPVAESGTLEANVPVGSGPYAAAYDPVNQRMYVLNRDSDNITVLNGSSIDATIGLTSYSFPDGIAYDPVNDSLYVAEYGSSAVAIVHNNTVAATVGLASGSAPVGVAYDPQNGFVYVADSASNTVSVISGATVRSTVNVSTTPEAITYDPVNGYVYVVNSGGGTVSVINGTTLIHSLGVGTTPQGIAVDPTSGLVYVANSGANTVSVLQGWTRIATLTVGSVPWGAEYDPVTGLVYIANSNSNSLSLISGTTVMSGSITVGGGPHSITFSPFGGRLAVTDYSGNAVSMVSTALWEGPSTVIPIGNPAASADVGQNVSFNASVWGVGAGGDNATIQVAPGGGLGCPSYVNLTYANGTGEFRVRCHPVYPGDYNISLVVTDLLGNAVRSSTPFTVFANPATALPVAQFDSLVATTSADVGQRITFTETVTGGAGPPQPFRWTGINASNCTALTSAHPVCTFPDPAVLFLTVSYTDTNGGSALSPTLRFPVYAVPDAARPTATPTTVDSGQTVTFSETVSGGPGTYRSFVWAGLPASGCSGLTTVRPKCTTAGPGPWNVSVTATDTNGETAQSPTLAFQVHDLPAATTPTASRTSLDVGQSVTFRTTASGGTGGYAYAWVGLPSFGCTNVASAAPTCVPDVTGPIGVWVIVNDSAGGLSAPTGTVLLTVLSHPSVAAPDVAPSTAAPGDAVTIRSHVVGGSGGLRYFWLGLPAGCGGTGAVVTCRPTAIGSYAIRVSVNDSNGYNVTSPSMLLEVANRLPTLFGLDPTVFYGSLVGIVAAAAIGAAFLLVRRRRRAKGPEEPEVPERWRYRADDPRLPRQRRPN